MARKRTRKSRRKKNRKSGKYKRLLLISLLIGGLASAVMVVYLDIVVRSQFEGKRWLLPARVYARPLELYAGKSISTDQLEQELRALGYQRSASLDQPGSWRRQGDLIRLHSRSFRFWDGTESPRRVNVAFSGKRLSRLTDAGGGGPLGLLRLDPIAIGTIHPASHEDRTLVRLDQVPRVLVAALLATEDRNFYGHFGLDPRGIARAMWVNLQAGSIVQGGSTLTQQLVKNFFLTDERSLWRKLREAVMAMLLEWHYDKNESLEAYLNEIYLGQDGRRAIHGVGLASHFYFARPLEDLGTAEAALLVAMVKGPSYYNPRRHPERVTRRRNIVIDSLAAHEIISASAAGKARSAPLGVTTRPAGGATAYPAFLDLLRRQLRRDYREQDLLSEGLRIFTTLDPDIQAVAESAVATRLQQLEKDQGMKSGTLEGVAVVTTVEGAEVLALVGGRQARFAGFNRALDAVRPIGSLIKPAVYLTALSQPSRYTLVTRLSDTAVSLQQPDGSVWRPRNFDRKFRGDVSLRSSLVKSLNLATVNLGLELGLPAVLDTVKSLGIRRALKPYPATLLGAAELSPVEVAQMYQTLAAGGFYSPLRSIRAVLAADGTPLQRYPLTVRAVDNPAAVFLLDEALQEAARTGTARALASLLPKGFAVAGKTGTTNELRDSWFAGFSGDRVAVVWVGRDNNESTGLTGSSGALRVWADIIKRVSAQPLLLTLPAGVEEVLVDRQTGLLADSGCSDTLRLPFLATSVPREAAPCAQGTLKHGVERASGWFKSLFSD